MLIYAMADLHGRTDRLERARRAVRDHHPDVIIAAGDLTGLRRKDLILAQIGLLGPPVLAVAGNNDGGPDLPEGSRGVTNLHLSRVEMEGTVFVGVGGASARPWGTRIGRREGAVLRQLAPLVDERTILVAHPPPRGVLDKALFGLHAGSPGLADLVREKRPRVLICGHIHERPGSDYLDSTLVINCALVRSGGALVEIQGNNGLRVEMLARD